nr:unnamed protein product [Digitaria exilis]
MAPNPYDVAINAAFKDNIRLLKTKDGNGGNALYFAAANGHLEVCRFLVEESGLDVNSTNADDE